MGLCPNTTEHFSIAVARHQRVPASMRLKHSLQINSFGQLIVRAEVVASMKPWQTPRKTQRAEYHRQASPASMVPWPNATEAPRLKELSGILQGSPQHLGVPDSRGIAY
jgi:hypothetical protein